ncbi:MAG: hypothetical protein Q9198_006686 [Flavoplaca austrocitrina]
MSALPFYGIASVNPASPTTETSTRLPVNNAATVSSKRAKNVTAEAKQAAATTHAVNPPPVDSRLVLYATIPTKLAATTVNSPATALSAELASANATRKKRARATTQHVRLMCLLRMVNRVATARERNAPVDNAHLATSNARP